jgi:hypothetical protein
LLHKDSRRHFGRIARKSRAYSNADRRGADAQAISEKPGIRWADPAAAVRPSTPRWGYNTVTGEAVFVLEPDDRGMTVRLAGRVDGDDVRAAFRLPYTPCRFGGLRRWWACSGCGRRAGYRRGPALACPNHAH